MSRQMDSRVSDSQQQKSNPSFSLQGREREVTGEDFYDMISDVSKSVSDYCVKRPKVAALGLLTVGFFLGWKIKPW